MVIAMLKVSALLLCFQSSCLHGLKGVADVFIPSLSKTQLLRSKSSSLFATDESKNLSEFEQWCANEGIMTPFNLKLRNGSYRFMEYSDESSFFNRPENLDGPILRVPLKACIRADTLQELAVALAQERDLGTDSDFAPYINVLPTLGSSSSLDVLPRFWTEEKMEKVSEFDGGQIYRRVQMDKESQKDTVDLWAYSCVSSRANFLGPGRGYAMTPVLDMINHDPASKTSGTVIDDELFLSVEKEFKIGDEVMISYGELTNLETLCDYGFVSNQKDSPFNKECVDVRIIRKAPVQVTFEQSGALESGSLALLRSYLTPEVDVFPRLLEDSRLTTTTVYAKKTSDTNEEELYSFIASFVDEAIYDGKSGLEWAVQNGDDLLESYLSARLCILEKGITNMKLRFPDLLY